MKLSQIYGMPVVSGDGKKRGYVLGVICALEQIEGYICCDEREYEYFAASKDVKISGGCLTVSAREKENGEGYRFGLGRPVYDRSGKLVGRIEEGTIKGGKLCAIKVGNRKLTLSDLILGDVVLLKESAPTCGADCQSCVKLKAKDIMIDALICGKSERANDTDGATCR